MSLGYHAMKMRLTTVAVDNVRYLCDGVNVVLSSVALPFQRFSRRVNQEAPWLVLIIASTAFMVVPLLAYPVLKPYITHDERKEREEERVRMCLQKGIDPYPYMAFKDFHYGNKAPLLMSDKEYPSEASWEWTAATDFYKKKEELRSQVGGNVDDTVDKLLKLKDEQRKNYNSRWSKPMNEPKVFTFPGREDENKLTS